MNQNFISRVYLRYLRYFEYSVKNPAWLVMFLFGRINLIRNLVKIFYSAPDLNQYREEESIFKEIEVNQVVESLRRNGYYQGINLPPDYLDEIINLAHSIRIQARNTDLSFMYSGKNKLETKTSNTFVHGFYPDVSSSFPSIAKLKNDPKLLKIAAQYLSCKPFHVRTDLSWCFVAEQSLYEQKGDAQILFHYDLDDYHTLKFFFYITDVNFFSGCHICVRGTHIKKKLIHQFSLMIGRSDPEIVKCYGQDNLVTICGEPGSGFAEDPFCFHRGTPPRDRDRLMLQIEFAANNYGMWTN